MTQQIIVNSRTIDILAVLMLITTIILIGTSRLRTCIWAYACRSFMLTLASGFIAYFSTQNIIQFENTFMRHCLPIALSITLLGFFVMISRKQAITHILGLITMGDGMFFAALSTSYGMPLIV